MKHFTSFNHHISLYSRFHLNIKSPLKLNGEERYKALCIQCSTSCKYIQEYVQVCTRLNMNMYMHRVCKYYPSRYAYVSTVHLDMPLTILNIQLSSTMVCGFVNTVNI